MLTLAEFEDRIKFYKTNIGNDLVENFLNNEFSDYNSLKDIYNNYGYKNIEDGLGKLNQIFILGKSFNHIISKEDFLNFLSTRIEFESDIFYSQSFYEIIYSLYLNDNDIFQKLNNNFKINFGGTFKFYLLNLHKYNNDIDSFLDDFNNNIKSLNTEYRKKTKTNPIIYMYTPDTINDYYVVHYGFNKRNKEIDDFFNVDQKINSSNSFYFFFYIDKDSESIYLAIRQTFLPDQIKFLKNAIDVVFGGICSYEPISIINFDYFDKFSIKSVTAITSILGIKATGPDFSNIISIDGNDVQKDYFKISKDKDGNSKGFQTKELKLRIKKYDNNNKELYSLNGLIDEKSIKIEGNLLRIRMFIDYLNGLGLLNNLDSSNFFTFSGFFKDVVYSEDGKIHLNKLYFDNFNEIKNYVKGYEYIGNKIEDKIGKELKINELFFSENSIKISSENYETKTDTIINNIILKIDLHKIFETILKKKYTIEKKNDLIVINFSTNGKWEYKNTKIIFSKNFKDLSEFLLTNQKDKYKYLAFIKGKFDNSQKIELIQNYQCILYDFNFTSEFIDNNELFIKNESSKIILQGDKTFSLITKRGNYIDKNEVNSLKLAESGDGTAFENIVADIFKYFVPIFVKLGSDYTGNAVPDGIIIDNNKTRNSIFLYDAKSSKNIRDYINSEVRKFSDYIDLFPRDGKNNIFLIFGPETEDNIEGLADNQLWKELIENKGIKIIYIGADIIDFLHYVINFPNYDEVKSLISINDFIDYFISIKKSPGIKQLELDNFKKYFNDNIFMNIKEINDGVKELNKNLTNRTKDKCDLLGKSNEFEEYIKSYTKLDK